MTTVVDRCQDNKDLILSLNIDINELTSQQEVDMSYDPRLQVLDRHVAAENAHDLAGTLATLTADCEFLDSTLGMRWRGHDGAAAHYTMWWNAFDLRVVGERLHLADGSAVAETTWTGTHVGTFAGVAATHRAVDFTVAVVIDFRDGLMAGERFYWDAAGLARQLGVGTLGIADRAAVCAEGRSA
jgi:steroid delta-isomerase-like uncharacterized protein